MTARLYPLLLLLVLGVASCAPISCPTEEDLDACTCKRMAFGLHVVCAHFNDTSRLVKAFKVLRDYRVQNVLLHKLRLRDVLPDDLFDGLDISELRVEESSLRFSEPAFSGLDDSLHVLDVARHTLIRSVENFSIAELHKLTELTIKSNRMSVVRDSWLNGKIPNVRSVRLQDDDIESLESGAFAQLRSLESVSVADNRIKVVERSMLPRPATRLKVINLSGNMIKSLPYDFFYEMPALEEVILSINDISTLPENTWKSVWETLHSVMLFENGLECDDRLKWIQKYRWPAVVHGTCVAPDKVAGKTLQEVYKT